MIYIIVLYLWWLWILCVLSFNGVIIRACVRNCVQKSDQKMVTPKNKRVCLVGPLPAPLGRAREGELQGGVR